MKKGTIIALIIAVLLVISGGVMLTLGLSYAEDEIQSPELTERTVKITDTFDRLVVDTEDCDVRVLLVSTWEEARVELVEFSQTKHTVTVEDDALKIELTDHRKWFDRVGVFWDDMQIRVYLPVEEYTGMHIITDTGDIEMPAYLTAWEVTLYSDTGDVYSETEAKLVSVETSTGNVAVCACHPEVVTVKTDTGLVVLGALEGVRKCSAVTNTGRIEVDNVKSETVTCESDTGDVVLWTVQAKENLNITTNTGDVDIGNSNAGFMEIETNTGDVGIEESDAGQVNIETNTGDVKGHFLTPKWFSAQSDTGNVNVPYGRDGGECRIESNTGDIHFR